MHGASKRLFRWLLFAYPAEFRCEYGLEMGRVFADRYQEERGVGRLDANHRRCNAHGGSGAISNHVKGPEAKLASPGGASGDCRDSGAVAGARNRRKYDNL
jgi:hypothetical protein